MCLPANEDTNSQTCPEDRWVACHRNIVVQCNEEARVLVVAISNAKSAPEGLFRCVVRGWYNQISVVVGGFTNSKDANKPRHTRCDGNPTTNPTPAKISVLAFD